MAANKIHFDAGELTVDLRDDHAGYIGSQNWPEKPGPEELLCAGSRCRLDVVRHSRPRLLISQP